VAFNHILWQGIMGNAPYPTVRSGLDLRKNRKQLLKQWETTRKSPSTDANHQAETSAATPADGDRR
jgi:hypothetical protein